MEHRRCSKVKNEEFLLNCKQYVLQESVLVFVISFLKEKKLKKSCKWLRKYIEEGCPIIFLITANKLKHRSSLRSQCENSRILIAMGNY